MKMSSHKKIYCALAGGLALVFSSGAHAYVPPAQFILKSLAGKHSGIKAIRVKSQVSALEDGKPVGVHFKAVTFFDPATGILKGWALDDLDQKLYKVEKPVLTPGASLIFDSNFTHLINTVREKGIPVKTEEELLLLPDEEKRRAAEVSFFSRWNGNAVWVLGKKDADTQLWIEKDTFLPLRFVLNSDGGELQMEGYRHYREFPFPKTTTWVTSSGKALIKDEVIEVGVNPPPAELKALEAKGVAPGYTDLGNAAPSALRDLIESYFKTFR